MGKNATFYLNQQLIERLQKESQSSGESQSRIVTKALEVELKKREK